MDRCGTAHGLARRAPSRGAIGREPGGRIGVVGAIKELAMGRYLLLWLVGVPLPILLLIWAFGGVS